MGDLAKIEKKRRSKVNSIKLPKLIYATALFKFCYVTVLELSLMFHLIFYCGNNFKLIASPNFLVLWVREFFFMNRNKMYQYGSNMVEDMILRHFRAYTILLSSDQSELSFQIRLCSHLFIYFSA